jgi:hypothetical protein
MTKLNQKEAVFKAICEVTGQTHAGEKAVELNDNQKAEVKSILVEGFKAGSIEISKDKTETQLKGYVNGLLDNWIRKDKRLNGNTRYEIKNKGSRSGQADEQVREMRKLLKTNLEPAQRTLVEQAIAKRVSEIKPAKTVTVNLDVIPQDLLNTLGIK